MARETFVTTTLLSVTANDIIEVDAPARGWITRVQIIEAGGGAFTATLYNRAFTSDEPVSINGITEGDDGKMLVISNYELPFAVGDVVNVNDALDEGSVSEYNSAYRVLSRQGAKQITLDGSYTEYAINGEIELAVPVAEQPLYEVLAITGTSGLGSFSGPTWVPLVNADPLPEGRSSKARTPLYIKLSANGSYRVSLTFLLPT